MFKKVAGSVNRARKAVTAAILAGGPLTLAALNEASPEGSAVSQAELIAVVVTAVVAFAGVYNMANDSA